MIIDEDIVLQINTLFKEEFNLLETAIEGVSLLMLEPNNHSAKLLKALCKQENLSPREYKDIFITSVHLYEKSIILNGFLSNQVVWDIDEYGECFFLKSSAKDLDEKYFDTTISFVNQIYGSARILEWFLNNEVICDWEDVLQKHDLCPARKLTLMDKDGVRKTVYRAK